MPPPPRKRLTLHVSAALLARLERAAKARGSSPTRVAEEALRNADMGVPSRVLRTQRQRTTERAAICNWVANNPGCTALEIREGLKWKRDKNLFAVELQRLRKAGYLRASGVQNRPEYFRTRKALDRFTLPEK